MTVHTLERKSSRRLTPPPNGAEEPFRFPWPGPGNSEGPVDPEGRYETEVRHDPSSTGFDAMLLTTTPWPGPGDSEG